MLFSVSFCQLARPCPVSILARQCFMPSRHALRRCHVNSEFQSESFAELRHRSLHSESPSLPLRLQLPRSAHDMPL